MIYVWIALIVFFLLVEAGTVALVSIWFAGGSLFALIVCLLGGGEMLQIIIFLLASFALLLLFMPLVKKQKQKKKTPTNADRILSMKAIVIETIDEIAGTGAVKVDGKEWSARAATGETIAQGTIVRVVRIEGVRAIVEPIANPGI